jgi:hypothetical protein
MKCCICGTVRNCESFLDKIFSNMELIGSLFTDYMILLYYDQSDDNTLNKMKEYQNKNSKFLFYVNKGELLPYRTHRIALGRNYCLNMIKTNFPDYEFFVMMDCDNRCAKDINLNLLKYYLHKNTYWDSLSFNHPDGYYDSWALSKIPYVASCHHFSDCGIGVRYITNMINNCPKDQLIKCISAFNGFAIYRTPKFINCIYDGRFRLDYIPKDLLVKNIKYAGKMNLSQNKEDCEHRFFHFSAFINNGARIRISPKCLFR